MNTEQSHEHCKYVFVRSFLQKLPRYWLLVCPIPGGRRCHKSHICSSRLERNQKLWNYLRRHIHLATQNVKWQFENGNRLVRRKWTDRIHIFCLSPVNNVNRPFGNALWNERSQEFKISQTLESQSLECGWSRDPSEVRDTPEPKFRETARCDRLMLQVWLKMVAIPILSNSIINMQASQNPNRVEHKEKKVV